MVIAQGEVWWADLPAPSGSGPGFRRPVVVVQGDALNRSRLATVVCVPLTTNLRWAEAPGNVPLPSRVTGLPKDSVANASQSSPWTGRTSRSEQAGSRVRKSICFSRESTWSSVDRGPRMLHRCTSFPDDEVAVAWHGHERARPEALGRPAPFADGQIAAIAHVNDLVLVTLNTRAFARFK